MILQYLFSISQNCKVDLEGYLGDIYWYWYWQALQYLGPISLLSVLILLRHADLIAVFSSSISDLKQVKKFHPILPSMTTFVANRIEEKVSWWKRVSSRLRHIHSCTSEAKIHCFTFKIAEEWQHCIGPSLLNIWTLNHTLTLIWGLVQKLHCWLQQCIETSKDVHWRWWGRISWFNSLRCRVALSWMKWWLLLLLQMYRCAGIILSCVILLLPGRRRGGCNLWNSGHRQTSASPILTLWHSCATTNKIGPSDCPWPLTTCWRNQTSDCLVNSPALAGTKTRTARKNTSWSFEGNPRDRKRRNQEEDSSNEHVAEKNSSNCCCCLRS